MRALFRLVVVLIILSSLFLISGCAESVVDLRVQPAVQDETLITGEPCLPPCWYGIIPEETSIRAAVQILMTIPFVDPKSVKETTRDLYKNTDKSILWNYQGTSDFGGDLSIKNGSVIWWQVSYPNYLNLEDIVDVIGVPNWVWAGRAGGGEIVAHVYRFYFRRSGLLLESRMYGTNMRQDSKVLLDPEIEITRSTYFRPQTIESYLVNIVGASEEQSDQIKELYRPWPGFGKWIETRPEF